MLLLNSHQGRVNALAFSPDGGALASGGEDERVRLWDPATGAERSWYAGFNGAVCAVDFSPDGRWLAYGGRSAQLVVREVPSGAYVAGPAFPAGWLAEWGRQSDCAIDDLAFSPDGGLLAAFKDPCLGCWQTGGHWQPPPGWARPDTGYFGLRPRSLAFSPDGRCLATTGFQGGARATLLSLRDSHTGNELGYVGQSSATSAFPHDLAFAPGGAVIAGACGRQVCVWAVPSGAQPDDPVFCSPAAEQPYHAVAFTPEGRFLAAAGEDGRVRFWDSSWHEVHAFDWGVGPLVCLAIAPDGMRAAAGSASGTVVIWDVDL